MSWLYIDCFSGISGDMTLGALLDLGVPLEYMQQELAKLPVQGYTLSLERRMIGALDAVKAIVKLDTPEHTDSHAHSHEHHHHHHSHEHSHSHEHNHDHNHDPDSPVEHAHVHRKHRDIRTLIAESDLNQATKQMALSIFARLAEAEAAVHNMPVADVTFHEVGAIDSIVDIVGTAIGFDYLNIERVICTRVPLGRGFVHCQHGMIPVPVPATMELLAGIPIEGTDIPYELVTPTGAAILAALVNQWGPLPTMTLQRVGYGAGTRVLPNRPNLLRVLLGTPQPNANLKECLQLEANLDDMTPELIAHTAEQLMQAGALDVWTTSITMKKGRQAHQLSILCPTPHLTTIKDILFQESSTLGFRYFPVQRHTLHREQQHIDTEFGPVLIKIGRKEHDAEWLNMSPEYEDCRRIANEQQIPLKRVYAAAIAAWQQRELTGSRK